MTFFWIALFITFFVQNKGTVFFPLSSVNITLPRSLQFEELLQPITQLKLLRAIPDHLVPANSSKVTFSIVVEPPDDRFYVKGDQLYVREELFQDVIISSKNYYIKISGELGGEDPAIMDVFVEITETQQDCENSFEDICFWRNMEFQIYENLEEPILGRINSPMLASSCKQLSLVYEITCQEKLDCKSPFAIKREDNDLEGWILTVADQLDRESSTMHEVRIKCSSYHSVYYEKIITVKVRDIDDTQPQMKFHSKGRFSKLQKGQTVASVTIEDNDHPDTNNLTITTSLDWLEIECDPPEDFHNQAIPKTIIDCTVISQENLNVTQDIPYTLIVEDTSLVPGYGKKTTTHELAIESEPVDMPTTKGSAVFQIPANSGKYTRVGSLIQSNGIRFSTKSPDFNITENDGIVYVINGRKLKKDTKINLTVNWITQWNTEESGTISIEIIEGKECGGKKKGWCAQAKEEKECKNLCGYYPSKAGGCQWIETIAHSGSKYLSCSADSKTCPDNKCDGLEQLHNGICPQDCTRKLLGSGSVNVTGIADASGTCYWEEERNLCQCSITELFTGHGNNGNNTKKNLSGTNQTNIHVLKEPTYQSLCGVGCQASVIGSVICIAIAMITMLMYIKRLKLTKERCSLDIAKEDVSAAYESSLIRPLRDPEPISRPEYYDKKWEFPRHRLTIEETVGEGEFGKVLKARADGIRGHKGQKLVAVKTLKSGAKGSEMTDLVSELQLLKDMDHPNIIKLLGACTTQDGPLYVIIEYAEHGSLRNYLKKHRQPLKEQEFEESYLEGDNQLTTRHIITFAWHIAKGMAYLAEMKLVHRDLAARNVLLTEDLVCKISDFGLTRDIYEEDTYLKRSNGKVPIKWMALESLGEHIYTIKSDVWSYGILLWELVTRGSSPYPGVPAKNLYNLLQEGYRMEKPPDCSPELYEIMRSCWANSPNRRPSFSSIAAELDAMLSASREYLALGPKAVENRQYMEGQDLFQWQFEGYDKPSGVCSCNVNNCSHVRYENELQAFNENVIKE